MNSRPSITSWNSYPENITYLTEKLRICKNYEYHYQKDVKMTWLVKALL